MLKRTLLLLVLLLSAPGLASAYTYWSVSFSTSPTVSGAITPPSGASYSTTGNTTSIVTSTVTTADFTVIAPTGYTLSYVSVDGTTTAPISANTYRVSKGSRITHSLTAVLAAKNYTITTGKTGNGIIDASVTVPAGSSRTINMTAGTGYRIGSVSAGDATKTGGDGVTTASYTYTNIQANKTISVVFELVPVVNAVISTTLQTIVKGAPATIDGSASTFTVTPTYSWSVTPAGATLTPAADGKTAVFSAASIGTWTVQLTLSAAGATPSSASVSISTVTQAVYDSTACTACHNDFTSAIDVAYLSSFHATTVTVSCIACHNPTGTLQHYFNLLHTTVSTTTFQFTDPTAGPVGNLFCANCHTPAQLVQSSAHATVACGTCHNNDVHKPDIAGGGVNPTFCASCHGVAANTNPVPTLSAAHGATACSGCHGSVPHNPHIANAGVNATFCSTCHGTQPNINAIPTLSAAHSSQCSACHGTSEHNPHIANNGVNATYCGSCHGVVLNVKAIPVLSTPHSTQVTCSGCHGSSEHNPHIAGGVNAAFCGSCHGVTAPAKAIPALSAAHSTTCSGCHGTSEHNPQIANNGVNATYCGSCHGVAPGVNPVPTLSAAHSLTCSGCHGSSEHNPHIANNGVNANYCGTCHGVAPGVKAIPTLSAAHSLTCSGCHGSSEHNPHIANNGVNATYCGTCHGVAPGVNAIPPLSDAHSNQCSACHGSTEHNPHIANNGVNATYCGTCHGVAPGVNAIPALSAGHATQCGGCHGNSEHNPHIAAASIAVDPCFSCHNKANQAHYFELTTGQLTNLCATCHNGHNHNPQVNAGVLPQHFNGYTSYTNPGYAAAYVTPATDCSNCHIAGDATSAADKAIVQFRQDWSVSPHGDTLSPPYLNSARVNWKASGMAGVKVSQAYAPADCQRCHTSGGYVLFSNTSSIAPLASAARYSEPITCNACHNADPSHSDFLPRTVTPRTGYYNYSSAKTGKLLVNAPFPDSLTSNICIGCHTGREAGDTIKAIAAATAHGQYSTAFWQNVSFVSSHWFTAGGQVFGVTGYQYPGQNYSNAVNHALVGTGVKGPCVTCHMPGQSHTRNPWNSGYDQCVLCHGSEINSTFVAAKTADFNAALQALGTALTRKGYAPNVVGGVLSVPYFTNKTWGNKESGPATMGAAFNYSLLMHDPGAFAHNPTYSKRLVRDSIDYLTNGSIDRSRDLSATVNDLLTTQTERDDAKAFLLNSANGSSACAVCHSASLDTNTGKNIVVTYNNSKHATRPGGATCSSCHAPTDTVAHPPTLSMLKNPSLIDNKCFGCHGVPQTHTWPAQGICDQCHGGHDPRPTVGGYPHFSSFSTAQFVAQNFTCTNCHNVGVGQPFTTYTSFGPFTVFPANREWAKSGHGNPLSTAYVGPGPYTEANLEAYDFKSLGTKAPASAGTTVQQDCVRCHTATGYLNYVAPADPATAFTSIAPWGDKSDRTRQMVGCPVCHVQTPKNQLDFGFTRRSVGIADEATGEAYVTAWFNYSSALTKKILKSKQYVDPNGIMTDSNLCVVCHSGKAVGDLIKPAANNCGTTVSSMACRLGKVSGKDNAAVGSTNMAFWSNVDLIDPHGGQAVNMLIDTTDAPHGAYEYWPTTYVAEHSNVGSGLEYDAATDSWNYLTQGPCVGCHMTSPQKHSFAVISSATNGTVSSIRSSMCNNCHGVITSPIAASDLQLAKQNYRDALTMIKNLLSAKNIFYNAAKAPYFFTTGDTTQQSSSTRVVNWSFTDTTRTPNFTYKGANLYGAAFNLRLLDTDSGWVHNPVYSRMILYDTIDYLDDGALNKGVKVDPNTPLYTYLTRPNF